jgi:hypothetical protein
LAISASTLNNSAIHWQFLLGICCVLRPIHSIQIHPPFLLPISLNFSRPKMLNMLAGGHQYCWLPNADPSAASSFLYASPSAASDQSHSSAFTSSSISAQPSPAAIPKVEVVKKRFSWVWVIVFFL